MRTLLVTLLMFAAVPALAEHKPAYAPAWDSRGLAREARQLDDAASAVFRGLYSQRGRSQLTHQARELAEATRGFRRQVERGAPYGRLYDSYRRVGHRYAALERRLANRHSHDWNPRDPYFDRRGGSRVYGLHAFEREYRQVGHALQRLARYDGERRRPDYYAWDRRGGDSRPDHHRRDRHDD